VRAPRLCEFGQQPRLVQQRVHVPVAVWLGLQAEGVGGGRDEGAVVVLERWHVGLLDKVHLQK